MFALFSWKTVGLSTELEIRDGERGPDTGAACTPRKQWCPQKGPGFCTHFLFLTLLLITRRSLQRKRWFHKEHRTLVKAASEAEAGGMVPSPCPLPVLMQRWDSVNPRGVTGA